MTSVEQQAAEVIGNAEKDSETGIVDIHGLARALADAGLLAPEPVDPNVTSIEGYHTGHPCAIWHADETISVFIDRHGMVHIENGETGQVITLGPEHARGIIPLLASAAAHAEKENES